MIFKIIVTTIIIVSSLSLVFPQQVDSLMIIDSDIKDTGIVNEVRFGPNADMETVDAEQQKLLIAEKYNLILENGISSKMLNDGAMHIDPDLNSPMMDVTIKRSEKVYAYKYFIEQRCWLINYKSSWGFIEDYLIMAVKEQDFTSYKDQWDVPPKIKTSIDPKYPKEAKKAKVEGSVELRIFISEKGIVTQTIILNGIEGLNDAAIEAINKAKYEPAMKNGKKTGVWVPTRIKFKL